AITAACGFVEPWAAVLIGAVAAAVAVWGIGFVERLGIDDPIGAVAVHGMAGIWGTLATGLFAAPSRAAPLATGRAGLLYTGQPPRDGFGRADRLRRQHLIRQFALGWRPLVSRNLLVRGEWPRRQTTSQPDERERPRRSQFVRALVRVGADDGDRQDRVRLLL